jgi:excisionase family DNA binding protein
LAAERIGGIVGEARIPTKMAKPEQVAGTFSVNEVHRLMGTDHISRIAIYNAIKAGTIPSIRIGTRILIPRAWLMAKLEGKK